MQPETRALVLDLSVHHEEEIYEYEIHIEGGFITFNGTHDYSFFLWSHSSLLCCQKILGHALSIRNQKKNFYANAILSGSMNYFLGYWKYNVAYCIFFILYLYLQLPLKIGMYVSYYPYCRKYHFCAMLCNQTTTNQYYKMQTKRLFREAKTVFTSFQQESVFSAK